MTSLRVSIHSEKTAAMIEKMLEKMQRAVFVFDGRNLLDRFFEASQ